MVVATRSGGKVQQPYTSKPSTGTRPPSTTKTTEKKITKRAPTTRKSIEQKTIARSLVIIQSFRPKETAVIPPARVVYSPKKTAPKPPVTNLSIAIQSLMNPRPTVTNVSIPKEDIIESPIAKGTSVVPMQSKPDNTLRAKNPNIKLNKATRDAKKTPKPKLHSRSIVKAPDLSHLSPRSRCVAGGPSGPKVYDSLGYELSYPKCAGLNLVTRQKKGARYFAMLDRESEERSRKREIMGTRWEHVSALTYMAWDDRVARELGIMYHEVGMRDFQELARRGFVGKEGEFEAVNMSEEEKDRLSTLATGSAFRA